MIEFIFNLFPRLRMIVYSFLICYCESEISSYMIKTTREILLDYRQNVAKFKDADFLYDAHMLHYIFNDAVQKKQVMKIYNVLSFIFGVGKYKCRSCNGETNE